MTKLDILVGIGLMLTGSLAYAIPSTQDFTVLYTALGGIAIATGGFIGRNHERLRRRMGYMSAGVAMMLLVWASFRLVQDSRVGVFPNILLIADLDAIGLCVVPVFLTIKNIIEARQRIQEEKEAMQILEEK